jgi:hypothetical protein
MKRLRNALEDLDEEISVLEDKIGIETGERISALKKQADLLKMSRQREVTVLAMAQKVAARLDHAIQHVEHVLRD